MQTALSKYSIKDLERLSGIKAHTIRIWEQRYNLLSPDRTESNIRLYNDEELKLILNIASLVKAGTKISHVVKLQPGEITKRIQDLVANPSSADEFFNVQVDNLVIAMLDLDDVRFEKVISTCTLRYGFEDTMLHLLIPFLQKVGIMWRTGEASILQEHFISNLIRKKVLVAIDAYAGIAPPDADRWVLFLPEGELHEIGLLFSKYLLKVRGKKVMYFGQTTPLDEIVKYCIQNKVSHVLTFITSAFSSDGLNSYMSRLASSLSGVQVLVAGGMVAGRQSEWPNVKVLNEVCDLTDVAGPRLRSSVLS
ncbi:MAG: MerR family transcriptional regulator [Bacteroidetes bacterium]|nr:MerR family transcriptional regulator [Bacteroidota bacterium]